MELFQPSRRELLKGLGGIVLATSLPLSLAGCGENPKEPRKKSVRSEELQRLIRGQNIPDGLENWFGIYDATCMWSSGHEEKGEEFLREYQSNKRRKFKEGREQHGAGLYIRLDRSSVQLMDYMRGTNGVIVNSEVEKYTSLHAPIEEDGKFTMALRVKEEDPKKPGSPRPDRMEIEKQSSGEYKISFLPNEPSKARSYFFLVTKR